MAKAKARGKAKARDRDRARARATEGLELGFCFLGCLKRVQHFLTVMFTILLSTFERTRVTRLGSKARAIVLLAGAPQQPVTQQGRTRSIRKV